MKLKACQRRCCLEHQMKTGEKEGNNLGNEKTNTGDREGEEVEDEIVEIVSV